MNHPLQRENQRLIELFEANGVTATHQGKWVGLPNGIRARTAVWDQEASPGIHSIQLDITLEIWAGRWIVESCGGYGIDRGEAIENAFETFAESSLQPLLVALFYTDHDVTRMAFEIGNVMRAITMGRAEVRGDLPDDSKLDMAWFEHFRSKLKEAAIPPGTHWIRLGFAQENGNQLAREVLLDNEPWSWMDDIMTDGPWPMGPGFLSLRLFLVLQGGLDVSRAIARMIEMPGRPDDEIAKLLSKDGADAREVQALLAFIPLAFGRVALRELPVQFAENAMVRETPDDPGSEIPLRQEPVFATAMELAESALHQGTLTDDQFLAVALRSAEVHGINDAMLEGAKLEDMTVTSPIVKLWGPHA